MTPRTYRNVQTGELVHLVAVTPCTVGGKRTAVYEVRHDGAVETVLSAAFRLRYERVEEAEPRAEVGR